jgi:hypothetical protein
MREALESVVAPPTAQNILTDALKRGALPSVPEEIETFRRFCEGPFRVTVRSALGKDSVEHVFERLGHVLWMATSDVQALEAARAWSRGTGDLPAIPDSTIPEADPSLFLEDLEEEEDSGVRHVEPMPAPTPSVKAATSATIGRLRAPTLTRSAAPRPAIEARFTPLPPSPTPKRATPLPPSDALRRPTTPVPPSMPLPPAPTPRRMTPLPPPGDRLSPLPGVPTPVRRSSSPPAARVPSAIIVVTLDDRLVQSIREDLSGQCPVRSVGTPNELAFALTKAGDRLVVVVDTALPAIDVPTFAGLAPILPATAKVVLWGASPRQQARLAATFPAAASWLPSGVATRAGLFVLDLP